MAVNGQSNENQYAKIVAIATVVIPTLQAISSDDSMSTPIRRAALKAEVALMALADLSRPEVLKLLDKATGTSDGN